MTRQEQIVKAAKAKEKETGFGELVKSPVSRGVNSAYGIGFLEGAEWADQTMLDKVCKWLKEHLLLDDPKWYVEGEKTLQEKMIDDLRKAMEQ